MARFSRFKDYNLSVFINCPFDRAYKPLFNSLVFTTIYCGFRARCALEIDDGSQVRIDKIFAVIEECGFGIHDLSRTQLDKGTGLPRFNMPLELGMFLGAKRFGDQRQKRKRCLILDRTPYRYQKYISDIAGQDIRAHEAKDSKAISITRDWLRNCSGNATLPGGIEINRQYARFKLKLPALCREIPLGLAEVTFNDYTNIATEWLKAKT
jgi:hypothetical protein